MPIKVAIVEDDEGIRASLAAHAPYSVAPSVFRAIREAIDRGPSGPCSVHLSESLEEVEFIQTGGGPWRLAAASDHGAPIVTQRLSVSICA